MLQAAQPLIPAFKTLLLCIILVKAAHLKQAIALS